MTDKTRWGLASMVKAPTHEILSFAAYHLDQGAHRLYIYLDDANPQAFAALKAHPKIRVTNCNDEYWQKRFHKRPAGHQFRQTLNATHAYNRRAEVDWLIHMDVDEFLWPAETLGTHLGQLDPNVLCARIRPQELLSGGTAYKAYISKDRDQRAIIARLYPQFGDYLKGGFLSHVSGKLFVRTGLENLTVKIHNIFQGDVENPGICALSDVDLCHNHAETWEDWYASFRYRLENGSYRAKLKRNRPLEEGGMSMHELFNWIEFENGEQGLRDFFAEVCQDSPELRERLAKEGLLRHCDLQLDTKLKKHFPDFA